MTARKAAQAGAGHPLEAADPDPFHFRRVLGHFPTGVVVITAIADGGNPAGLSVGSFTSVSLDPPLVAFMPGKTSTSWPTIAPTGRFCVNVLAAEQEAVCRQFARSGTDKFRGISWQPAPSGAPIIDEAIAWIDCELERVDEAGDHLIVLGRVRDLGSRAGGVPLIFFQGGYGRFDVGSVVADGAEDDLGESLRIVDRAHAEMEHLATAVNGECLASALVGDEVVLVAGAGPLPRRTSGSLIGQRIRAIPPAGATWMAWEPEPRVAAWLTAVPDAEERREIRARLDRIRYRRYGFSLEGISLADWERLLVSGAGSDPERIGEQQRRVREFYEPSSLEPRPELVRTIHVPVFGIDGRVAILLNVSGFDAPTPTALTRVVGLAQDCARRITEAIGGREPDPPEPSVAPAD